MNIYLKLDKKPKTIRQLLLKLFSAEQPGNSHITAVETYYDKECKHVQCTSPRSRSFDDVLDICKTYFPKTNPKIVFKNLILLNPDFKNGEKTQMYFGNCGTINRIKFYYVTNDTKKVSAYTPFNCTNKLGSRFSWQDLTDMLNIKTPTEYLNYIDKNKKDGKENIKKQEN